MKGKVRQNPMKYVPYYWIASKTTYQTLNKLIFLDICPGQNKNHIAARFFAISIANGRFNKILQYFHVQHSYIM